MSEIVIPILYYFGEVFGNYGLTLSQRLYHQYRLYNYTFLSVNVIGIQKCVSECMSRQLCKSVNFDTIQLNCELNWMTDSSLITMTSGFIIVEMQNENFPEDGCSQCSAGDRCVALTSGMKHCLEETAIDCTDIMKRGFKSGVHLILVPGKGWLNVSCDMETDGGGWLIFQRRCDGKTNFTRNWNDYKVGFGNLSAEFWLGNDALYHILQLGNYELRMDMSDFENNSRYVKYQSINIGNETSGYLMSISGYSGNVDDCFTHARGINNMKFTTYDRDNDKSEGICSDRYKGGWWYNHCHCANPNGLYLPGHNSQEAVGIVYIFWKRHYYSLKTIKIMIRRKV